MFRPALAAALTLLAVSGPALAETVAVDAFSYDLFEATVPHVDLDDCPVAYADENHFCRANLHHGALNIFIFSYEGDMPLVAIETRPAFGLSDLEG